MNKNVMQFVDKYYQVRGRPNVRNDMFTYERVVELITAFQAYEWHRMDTAPKDGTEVLLMVARRAGIPYRCLVGHWMPGGHCIEDHPPIDAGWYFWNGVMFDLASEPLYWSPLPEVSVCNLCTHSLIDNQHGFDQNDGVIAGDRLVHSGRCTYCKECNPQLEKK